MNNVPFYHQILLFEGEDVIYSVDRYLYLSLTGLDELQITAIAVMQHPLKRRNCEPKITIITFDEISSSPGCSKAG